MIGLALVVALGAAGAPEAPPPESSTPEAPTRVRVIVLDVTRGALAEDTARAAGDLIAVTLADYRALDVTSGEDVRRALELEGERAAAGCDDEGCLAEIAGALGAELAVFGRGAKLGEVSVITLSLFDSIQGRTVGRVTLEFRDPAELLEKTRPAVAKLVEPELRRRGLLAETPVSSAPSTAPSAQTPPAAPGAPATQPETTDGAGGDEGGASWPGWTLASVGAAAVVTSVVAGGLIAILGAGLANGSAQIEDLEQRYRDAADPSERAAILDEAGGVHDGQMVNAFGYYGLLAMCTAVGVGGLIGVGSGAAWALSSGGE